MVAEPLAGGIVASDTPDFRASGGLAALESGPFGL
jgi:hypothetical protein